MTRHGAGPFETECGIAKINAEIRDLTNVYNAHQGHIRYGTIDADKLFERISADYMGIKGKNGAFGGCYAYERNGRQVCRAVGGQVR